jgi:hypothetical protein
MKLTIKAKILILLSLLCIIITLSAPVYATMETKLDPLTDDIRFIYHACGAIDGNAYSNSLEALESTYAKGGRFVEIDLNWTTDGELVCIHDFGSWVSSVYTGDPVSLETFMNTKIFDQYTPMSIETLANWICNHPDMYIVTDVKEDNVAALQKITDDYPALVSNIIPQIYEKNQLLPVREAGYEHIILTIYAMASAQERCDAKTLAAFAKENGLFGITFPLALADDDNYVATLKTSGVKLFTHSTSNINAIQTYFKKGIDGVYTHGLFDCPYGENCSALTFMDISKSVWYHEDVDYVYNNGLFTGISETAFEPETIMTRDMLVTVLWRLEGEPTSSAVNYFTDVAEGTWYTMAVIWASENEIVNGYDADTFGTNDPITREQMATILYRYAVSKSYDIPSCDSLSTFMDGGQVSDWALAAIKWAVAEGLIQGVSDTSLDPSGKATRAQVAAILHRFCELPY